MREQGLEPRFFCGGGWYIDEEVAAVVAEVGYADCTGIAFVPSYLPEDEPLLAADEPLWLTLSTGQRLLELPATHSLGMAARGATGSLPRYVHVYFHDTDLLSRKRRLALYFALELLSRRCEVTDLDSAAKSLCGCPPSGRSPYTDISVASEPAPSEQPAGAPEERRDLGDIRRAKPFVVARSQLRTVVFRVGGVALLIFLDICGLALALYAALALREVYYGNTPILWGVLWEAEREWLPFVALVMVLVFSQARLYASRERRAGFGKVVSSLFLVALLTFAFGVGIGHEFSTFGLIPTTAVIAALLIGLFRASYDVVTQEIFHLLGVRRRAVLVGEGEHLLHLYRTLGAGRSGIEYELLASSRATRRPTCRCLGSGARSRCGPFSRSNPWTS